MEPQKRREFRAIIVQDSEDDEDTGSTFSDASDISWEETAADANLVEVNLDSLLPLNTATMLEEATVLEEGAAEFLHSAPALEVADVEFEELEDSGLLVADSNEMRVTAVECRTCWPLLMVQSSSANVLLRPLPATVARRSLAELPSLPPPQKPPNPPQLQRQHHQPHNQQPQQRSLLEMLTQPKVVPHNPEMHTVHLPERPRQEPPRVTLADRLASAAVAATGLQFQPLAPPPMSRCEKVPYLHGFRLGDTYQLHSKLWLLPQLLCGALALTGILLTLVGIIMLQINKYLVSLCSTPGESFNCRTDEESITSVTMSIGVGTAGGGLSLILICAIVFLHAYCVIYNEGEHHKIQENVSLHVPAATTYHANMLELSNAIQTSQHQHQHDQDPAHEQLQVNTRENGDSQPNVAVNGSNLVRCQSQYDNLQEITDDLV